jgi:hypothetical protein
MYPAAPRQIPVLFCFVLFCFVLLCFVFWKKPANQAVFVGRPFRGDIKQNKKQGL